jgi:Aldo/keto reductase family
MNMRKLGSAGPLVSEIGLGCMAMSGVYGPADEQESIQTIQEAIDQGVNLLDTGDFYGMGHNEMLISRAIHGRRDKVLLSVKFGALRTPSGAWGGYDGRPVAVKNFLAYSLRRLGVDHIDIYRPARLDATVPIEETVGAIVDLIKEGYVRHIGLSECRQKPCGGPERCIRLWICKSNIRWCRAEPKTIFCRRCVKWELGLPRMACFPVGCSAVRNRRAKGIFADISRGSWGITCRRMQSSWKHCRSSEGSARSAGRSWRLLGCCSRAKTLCRCWDRERARSFGKHWERGG